MTNLQIARLGIVERPPRAAVAVPRVGALQGPMGNGRPSQLPRADHGHADLLVAVSERRDRQAFALLFGEFAPRIKAYARRSGADSGTAEDLAQDVMLTVWRRAGQFDRRKAGVSTWIFTIARNRRIDILRRERRPEIDPNEPAIKGEPEPSAEQAVLSAEGDGHLRGALARLPGDQADLLRLAYFEDKSHSVIAAQLDLPLGTVKSRIRAAMGTLRGLLREVQ